MREYLYHETDLHGAALEGDLAAVKALLERGDDPNVFDEFGYTELIKFLHLACREWHRWI